MPGGGGTPGGVGIPGGSGTPGGDGGGGGGGGGVAIGVDVASVSFGCSGDEIVSPVVVDFSVVEILPLLITSSNCFILDSNHSFSFLCSSFL